MIYIEKLREQAIIRQQIALNSWMFEIGKIPKYLHGQTYDVLLERLTKAAVFDIIVDE